MFLYNLWKYFSELKTKRENYIEKKNGFLDLSPKRGANRNSEYGICIRKPKIFENSLVKFYAQKKTVFDLI